MKRLKIAVRITWIIGIISFVLFVLERLALQDIWHGEPDATLEWRIVLLSFLPILLFYISSLVTGVLLLKSTKPESEPA